MQELCAIVWREGLKGFIRDRKVHLCARMDCWIVHHKCSSAEDDHNNLARACKTDSSQNVHFTGSSYMATSYMFLFLLLLVDRPKKTVYCIKLGSM